MSSIIKITDTSIDVNKIMSEISEKANKIRQEEVKKDLGVISSIDSNSGVSPNIIQYIKRPSSKKSGIIAKVFNKIIEKIYFIIWNSLGDALTRQQNINLSLIQKINLLEAKLEKEQARTESDLFDKFNYVEFENRMRGDVSVISERQKKYVAIMPQNETVLDIGCGRGEFLELLNANGVKGEGVEINRDMIEVCKSKGIKVYEAEAVDFLTKTQKKYGAIFASHVVEHISFSHLVDLVNTAYSQLVSGGKLIIETPNPTTVATHIGGFYSDPTHLHFVHPQLVKFIAEQAGFRKVEFIFASEQDNIMVITDEMSEVEKKNMERLNQVIFGFQEYAIIAEK